MWKKDDEPKHSTATPFVAATTPSPERPRPSPTPAPRGEQATIGRSITINGDVSGDEDLVIQGRIEGTVNLQQHNVTIGPEGRVKANISGRTVTIEGEVEGDVRGAEQVALRSASKVHGDIVAPRVVLEDGATFLGSIDMSGKAGSPAKPKPAPMGPAAGSNEPSAAPSSPRADAAKA